MEHAWEKMPASLALARFLTIVVRDFPRRDRQCDQRDRETENCLKNQKPLLPRVYLSRICIRDRRAILAREISHGAERSDARTRGSPASNSQPGTKGLSPFSRFAGQLISLSRVPEIGRSVTQGAAA
jgi:hypothetical protein